MFREGNTGDYGTAAVYVNNEQMWLKHEFLPVQPSYKCSVIQAPLGLLHETLH